MKKIHILTIFLILSVFLYPAVCFSQEQNASFGDSLEKSISDLKKSAEDLMMKNRSLKSEIQEFLAKTDGLDNQLQILGIQRQTLIDQLQTRDVSKISDEMIVVEEKEAQRLTQRVLQQNNEKIAYQKKIDLRQGEIKKIQDQINVKQKELETTQSKLKDLLSQLDQKSQTKDKADLERKIKQSELDLEKRKKQLSKLQNEFKTPLIQLKELQKENNLLKQKEDVLKDELRISRVEKTTLEKELNLLESDQSQDLVVWQGRIDSLKQEHDQLVKTLQIAKEKLDKSNLDIDSSLAEENRLKSNLGVLEKENEELQKRYRRLSQEAPEEKK